MCKKKIEKIIHDIKSPQTYKEFVPPPTNHALLRAQLEHGFDFDDLGSDDDDDSMVFRMSIRAPDLFRMLQPYVQTERLNLARLTTVNLTELTTNITTTNTGTAT